MEKKYFYELIKEERLKKSLKIMIKYLKTMIQYKSKENMDYRRLFSQYCDSNLRPWGWLYIFAQSFLIKISFLFVVVFKISPVLYASNNTPCVWIYYCATSLRNHRLFLIPHFELWNLSSTALNTPQDITHDSYSTEIIRAQNYLLVLRCLW